MTNRITAIILIVILLAVPLLSLAQKGRDGSFDLDISGGAKEVPPQLDALIAENVPFRRAMERIENALLTFGGKSEFDGIFMTDGDLIENYRPDKENGISENLRRILQLISMGQMPSYVMLIPTECVVLQEKVPGLAPIFNQKTLIDTVYGAVQGSAVTVDAYGALFRNRYKYIYYNSHPLPTSIGGYYLYREAMDKLGGQPNELSEYEVSYAGYGFYGSLYERVPMDGAKSDMIALYKYTSYDRRHNVTHYYGRGQSYTYDRLFIPEFESSDDKTDIIFGGLSPVMTIESDAPSTDSLLIFGDETAKSYVPFLADHYAKITVVMAEELTPELARLLSPDEYRQVLFAFSVATLAGKDSLLPLELLFGTE